MNAPTDLKIVSLALTAAIVGVILGTDPAPRQFTHGLWHRCMKSSGRGRKPHPGDSVSALCVR